ncbi:MAG: DUF128 domain-containing protein [Methanosarcinales archaeon]|nr:DUF128 domain-containing protein [Methanosarcinales archaeon]
MKLLTKAHSSQRRLIEILRVIDEADKPIGARAISDLLSERGYEIGERAVRYNLKILDELGFTKKHGYTGRALTHLGMRELSDALVNERIGFVNAHIEEYMYRTTFDPATSSGDVVVNASLLSKNDFEQAFDILREVFDAGYAVSRRVMVLDEGDSTLMEVPAGCICLATICSITMDGILLKAGVPVNTSFAGVAMVRGREILQFTDLIAYAGSSLDPIKAFMSRRIARVSDALRGGTGTVLANVREIPISSSELAQETIQRARQAGIGGLVHMGESGITTFGCPVGAGKIGIAICAGVNGPVAVEEAGIQIKTLPISAMLDYSKMQEVL